MTSPDRNGLRATLVLSAPVDPRPYTRAVMPARAYRAFQHLFGYDAQLRAFAEAAQRAGARCFLVPAPEIFSAPPAFARLLEPLARAGGKEAMEPDGAGRLLHVRFGPVRLQRVLKSVASVGLVAEAAWRRSDNLGRHPFACGDVLPATCLRALGFEADAPALRAPLGGTVPYVVLPPEMAVADLPRPTGAEAEHEADFHDEPRAPAGLQVQSLQEFDAAGWGEEPAGRPHPASMDFRRVLVNQQMEAERHGGGARLVMLPWNLAHDGGALPMLMERLSRFAASADTVPVPVLFPFNLAFGALDPLVGAVARLREVCSREMLTPDNLFVARLTDPRDAAAVARLFPLAWTDATDPEHAFTLRRLAHLGIAAAAIAPPDAPPAPEGLAPAILAPALEEPHLTHDDVFGPRRVRAALPSPHALAGLVRATLEHVPAQPAASGPGHAASDMAAVRACLDALVEQLATDSATLVAGAEA